MDKQYFDNNQGVGGFEVGGYDRNAIHPTDTNWTRQSRFELPKNPKLRWSIVIPDAMVDETECNPGFAVDSKGSILVADSDPLSMARSRGRLWRITKEGEKQIIFETHLRLRAPVIGEDGAIYIVNSLSADESVHRLFCIHPNGEVKWIHKLEKTPVTRPVIDKDCNIYLYICNEIEGTFLSIKKDGTLNWSKDFRGTINGEPIISEEGIIYLGYSAAKTYLCALKKDGELLWEKQFNQGGMNSPFNINKKQEIFTIMDGKLVVCKNDGAIEWEYENHGPIKTPSFDAFGNIYMNVTPFSIVSLTPEGKERWLTEFDTFTAYFTTVDKDNNILQICEEEKKKGDSTFINAFTMEGERLWKYELDGIPQAAILGDDQLLYVITNRFRYEGLSSTGDYDVDWILYAIESKDTGGL